MTPIEIDHVNKIMVLSEKRRIEIDRLKAVIRLNMIRYAPHLTHEEIDEVIETGGCAHE